VSDTVEFYWRPGCPFCIALRSRLRRSAIPVRVGEHALVNPSIRQVIDLVRQAAPQLLEQAEQDHTRRQFWPFSSA